MFNFAGKATEAETPNALLINLKIRSRLIAGFAVLSLMFATGAQAGSTTTGHGEEASGHAVVAAIDEGHGEEAEEASEPKHATKKGSAPHWTYAGKKDGPDAWGSLATDFETCSAGRMQSPINLSGDAGVSASTEAIEFDYRMTPLTILHNGHTVQVNYAKGSGIGIDYRSTTANVVNIGHTIQVNCDPGSSITLDGTTFHLLQYHFHHPSEHLLSGRNFDLEAHFVHASDDGTLAVLGVFVQPGAHSEALAPVWSVMPRAVGKARGGMVQPADLLPPADRSHFRYFGSLTTPPCSQKVIWSVFRKPVEMSVEQVRQFASIFPMNARPVQQLNRRMLLTAS